MKKAIEQVFGIDPRALAAFRIGAALTILLDLFYRSRDLTAFYTDAGVMPRLARIELYEVDDAFAFADMWSLHMMSGQFWGQLILLLIAAIFAVGLLVGYRTKLTSIVTWVLLVSLDSRNPMVLNSGDTLLRCQMFWVLFLPLGERWSVDRFLSGKGASHRVVVSSASAALMLQLAMMYFFSALFKTHAVWLTERSAVYYALNCEAYMTSVGVWLQTMPSGVLEALTIATYLLEFVGPLIIFLPFWTSKIRTGVVITFWLFHAGLAVAMTIGFFPAICMVCWIVFLPPSFWDRLETWLHRATGARETVSADDTHPTRWQQVCRITLNGLVGALLLYVVVWNIRELDFESLEPKVLPREYNRLARALALDQNWAMFSPVPRTEDGWLVMRGELRDGSEVNLWEFDAPLPWQKPELVSQTYHSQRWRKYLDNLTTEPYALHRMHFANWLASRWNDKFARDDESREVVRVEIIQRLEITPPPGTPIPAPQDRVLWTWLY